jgi:fucokinase
MQSRKRWDYLIVTAANDQQARAYELQLARREGTKDFERVRRCFVVADIDGRRIGSGGSTLHCLSKILEIEQSGKGIRNFEDAGVVLSGLRILIVHASGDSRRLPPYSDCGKMFVPLPDKAGADMAATLFDRLIPKFLDLPDPPGGRIVIASGDALILFDPSLLDLSRPGITAFAKWAPAAESANHGVFCALDDGLVARYLQKPPVAEQESAGAINAEGKSLLDLGVMSCDAAAGVQLLRTFFANGVGADGTARLVWKESSLPTDLSRN